jgi:hypothetical protein
MQGGHGKIQTLAATALEMKKTQETAEGIG